MGPHPVATEATGLRLLRCVLLLAQYLSSVVTRVVHVRLSFLVMPC
jgi:hypothetical protein